MTIADHCAECGDVLDPLKRLYRGPGGLPRCPICQVLFEMRLEIVRVTKLADVLEAAERRRGDLI